MKNYVKDKIHCIFITKYFVSNFQNFHNCKNSGHTIYSSVESIESFQVQVHKPRNFKKVVKNKQTS